MLLSRKTKIYLTDTQANYLSHMNYAASKLWNALNYERNHHKSLGLERYPDWYYQKKVHKDSIWYRSLPSQTAQEVCKLLDKAWKSFFVLQKTGGVESPRPPRYKKENIPITYMQNGIRHSGGSAVIRLSLPRQLKQHMEERYDLHENYLYLENSCFQGVGTIKQIKLYPPEKNCCRAILVYEVPDVEPLPDNGRYLAVDLGLHNLMTCLDSTDGSSFILGRRYLSICRKYDKEIARVQSQWYSGQAARGVKHPKGSKHLSALYGKKAACVKDYLHKITRYAADYCLDHGIHTVVIGDIKGIRKGNDLGARTNQKLHGLPYEKVYLMLGYKLALYGIRLIRQKEAYSSQCSPLSPEVSEEYAVKRNRVHRGLYRDGGSAWNADCVGAFNILRLYLTGNGRSECLDPYQIQNPRVVKVAA